MSPGSSRRRGRPSGIEYGLIGGIGLGCFNIAIGAFPEHLVAWPLAIIKLASIAPIALLVVVGRRPWRIPRPVLPIVVVGAISDLAGTGLGGGDLGQLQGSVELLQYQGAHGFLGYR